MPKKCLAEEAPKEIFSQNLSAKFIGGSAKLIQPEEAFIALFCVLPR